MTKYSEAFKQRVVDDFLASGDSYRTVGERHGLEFSIVRRWVALFRTHGTEGLKLQFRRQRYSSDFKLKVLQHRVAEQLSFRAVAVLFNLRHSHLISTWQRQYDSGGVEALKRPAKESAMKHPPPKPGENDEVRSREELLKDIAYLRMENAYLKKMDALIQADKRTAQRKKRK